MGGRSPICTPYRKESVCMTLEMKGIYKSFGANDVLRDVSFTLNGGEICALLGENGAGKSTLMNMRIRARSCWTASALRFKRRRIP